MILIDRHSNVHNALQHRRPGRRTCALSCLTHPIKSNYILAGPYFIGLCGLSFCVARQPYCSPSVPQRSRTSAEIVYVLRYLSAWDLAKAPTTEWKLRGVAVLYHRDSPCLRPIEAGVRTPSLAVVQAPAQGQGRGRERELEPVRGLVPGPGRGRAPPPAAP